MKRIIVLALAFCFMFATNALAVSDWAKTDFNNMLSLGVLESVPLDNTTVSITRNEFARVVFNTYSLSDTVSVNLDNPFHDTADKYAATLYSLGIITGDNNGNFNGNNTMTRQELSVILCRLYKTIKKTDLSDNADTLNKFSDCKSIADWAKPYVSKLAANGIMKDMGDGSFNPTGKVTVEQAVVLLSRIVNEQKQQTINLKLKYNDNKLYLSWDKNGSYKVNIKMFRNTKHCDETGFKEFTYDVSGTSFETDALQNKKYLVEIYSDSETSGVESVDTGRLDFSANKTELESIGLPQTKEEADALMQDITVKVWALNGDEKTESTAQLTVHKEIADKVIKVFDDIFAGEEKFPVQSVSAYCWRGGVSEHNYGTAIDINPTQNYCIYKNGTIVGDYWQPYEDPYSITPFGDVVNAFENNGFNWGGDTWTSNRDYMHFSYMGT